MSGSVQGAVYSAFSHHFHRSSYFYLLLSFLGTFPFPSCPFLSSLSLFRHCIISSGSSTGGPYHVVPGQIRIISICMPCLWCIALGNVLTLGISLKANCNRILSTQYRYLSCLRPYMAFDIAVCRPGRPDLYVDADSFFRLWIGFDMPSRTTDYSRARDAGIFRSR